MRERERREREREMHAIWVSLKETANCRVKLTNVVSRAGTCGNRSEKDILEREPAHCTATPIRKAIFGQTRTLLYGLNTGDPSRNIVELIFQRASTNPSKPSRKIKTVLKVKNSVEILDRFEEYREKVKKKAYERYKRNPRSTVDGNELLRFYGSTMVCYSGKSKRVSELCKDPTCEVCRIIESNFDTDRTRRYGVRLSTGSDDSSENMIATTRVNNIKRAVIVCRAIAGSIGNMWDGEYEGFDSVGSGLLSNLECLIVPNPNAILPCFVIVFD